MQDCDFSVFFALFEPSVVTLLCFTIQINCMYLRYRRRLVI